MKDFFRSPMVRILTTIGFFTLALPGCRTDAEAICDDKCECEGCSDRQYDDCNIDALNKESEADAKGCLDFYDDLKACEYDTGTCTAGNEYETACKTEKERYDNCKK